MSFQSKRNEAMTPKHLNPSNIVFSMFTTEELRKLCVTKIVTPLTFDILGYPITGGLYDKTLGPITEKGDPCGTCYKNLIGCPGHFGYIELPLPVVNPLFHKSIASILRITCLSCFYVQIPMHIKHSLSIQIKLLNCGLLSEAIDIENKINELIAQYDSFEKIPEDAVLSVKEYEALADKSLEESGGIITINKNTESLRNQFVNGMLKSVKARKTCLHCKETLDKISTLKNKLILTTKQSKSDPSKVMQTKHINPEESRGYIRKLWENEREFLIQLMPVLQNVKSDQPTDVLFFEIIPVPPVNVRPVNVIKGSISENQQTVAYRNILENGMLLRIIIQVIQTGNTDCLQTESRTHYNLSKGSTAIEKLSLAYESLQIHVNELMDKERSKTGNEQGLKQIIEKKEGIIRMHMMGKRVNFAARSVITPDPNLNIDEIGVPEAFAKHLTYPVPVTAWNVEELRKMINNGPLIHPGAISVEFENGITQRIDDSNKEAILKRLLTPDAIDKNFKGVKKVYRHLCNGDIMLLNRQPTLHKPSIMAHTARILKGEKTLRLHYANCKAYNADFDGDEMNAHFPQNELARSEGYTIANVSNQYLVPKDGTPLSGLIQDHMISGVRLSVRGKFFSKYDYQQLIYQALALKTTDIILLPPTILKPQLLWSGKQILSTVILNIIPKGKEPINLTSTSKIPAKAWENAEVRPWKAGGTPLANSNDMSEAEVVIRQGQLLVGVLDKTHYGATPYGLVHCMYELYGGTYAIKLLSALAKLFMRALQREGFTLGVHDILCLNDADIKRRKIVKNLRKIGKSTITQALNISDESTTEEIVDKIEEQSATNPKIRNIIDRQYKSALDSYTNDINKTCLPAGLICKFPYNNLQLMVQSGAKGSTVNTMQISCLLGQIELEGKRPPIMISGKSLPSFPMFEFAPRAGGFIDGRFMTGIQPQEFFFHCMAGREGLIDTAVKTSRSGYLQRCLIKHLEGLSVAYDLTVRDSDKSVIQFYYGEDGMDISKAQFLNSQQLPFLADNYKAIFDKDMVKKLKLVDEHHLMEEHNDQFDEWKKANGNPLSRTKHMAPFTIFSHDIKDKMDKIGKKSEKISGKTGRAKNTKFMMELWQQADDDVKKEFVDKSKACPEPTVSKYLPDSYYGSINERLSSLIDDYKIKTGIKSKKIENMMKLKAMQSLCDPGEPVGLLAAQSIGEPSTQMTLNTFHFAGRGEMNVTLGIPRLREILMMASKNLKTPSMEIPFLNVPNLETRADKLRKILTRVVVADVLEKIDVTRELEVSPIRQHKIVLRFQFMPKELYKNDYYVKPKKIMNYMETKFFKLMFSAIRKYAKVHSNMVGSMEEDKKRSAGKAAEDGEYDMNDTLAVNGRMSPKKGNNNMDSSDSDDEPEDTEDAKQATKFEDVQENQDPEADEIKAAEHLALSEDEDELELDDKEIDSKRSSVIDMHALAQNYVYDQKKHMWCELTFALPLNYKKIDLTAILKEVASKAVLHETLNIKRAITYMKNDTLTLRTDGINIVKMFEHRDLLDLNKLYSNDIHQVAATYGIEAAMKVIVREVQDVFKVYGITVDPRHLLLIADYMTFNGTFEPLSRKGMENSASPMQQMSFESSLTFLKSATIRGKQDKLQNPSSCLMVGKPCNTGTGSFTLLQKIPIIKQSRIVT